MKEFNPESPISSLVNDYEKVIKVIESSQNLDQLEIAESYVELFKQKHEQEENFLDILSNSILGKKMKIKSSFGPLDKPKQKDK
jgi:hypothetical protein